MKASNYNFAFPYGEQSDQTIFYNSRTNALALIENEKYDAYKAFCENGTTIADERLVQDLTYGGFLVDSEVEELDLIRYALLQSRFSGTHLGLTIAPTSDCNFRCVYCYEKDSLRPSTMTEDIQKAVVDYVKRLAPTIADLHISWYGGEPLLALDIIERLTNEIYEICEENKVSYSASIVTNGYLLKPEVAKKLGELHVSGIQVTLDGSKEQHDQRRPLKGGQPTFDGIISNLKESKNDLPCRVAVRVNVDKQNVSQVDEVLKILSENDLNEVTSVYLGMVENSNDIYQDSKCFCVEEFSEVDYDFKMRNGVSIVGSYPNIVHNVCSADSVSGLVIDSDGMIYKCWNEIGAKEKAVGNLLDSAVGSQRVVLDYLLYDPTRDQECKDCKYLPICMGGCPHRRQYAPQIRCTTHKYMIDKYIADIAAQLKSAKEDAAKKQDDSHSQAPLE